MTKPSRTAILEAVLDEAFRGRHERVIKFTTLMLSAFAADSRIIDKPPRWWGSVLTEYRTKESFRYRVVAEGYGRKASWRAIAKEQAPAIHRLRQSQDHHLYVVQDAIKREGRDLDHEVLPALKMNHAGDADIAYRISEFEVTAVQRLVAAGMSRSDALTWIEPEAAALRDRWAA